MNSIQRFAAYVAGQKTTVCPVDGTRFILDIPNRKYCSPGCRTKAYAKKWNWRTQGERLRASEELSRPREQALVAEVQALLSAIKTKFNSEGVETISIDFEGPAIYHQTSWMGPKLPNHEFVEVIQSK